MNCNLIMVTDEELTALKQLAKVVIFADEGDELGYRSMEPPTEEETKLVTQVMRRVVALNEPNTEN